MNLRVIHFIGGNPAFWCAVCGHPHVMDRRWKWNGNRDKPTFGPVEPGVKHSFLCFTEEKGVRHTICHTYVTDGLLRVLGDTPGPLSGKTVALAAWDGDTYGGVDPEAP